MTKKILAIAVIALPILAAGAALAGPTDGSRQQVSPPEWQQGEPRESRPFSLTGEQNAPADRDVCSGWTRGVERLGNKVEVDSYRRNCRRR